jgi:hypothetical protein
MTSIRFFGLLIPCCWLLIACGQDQASQNASLSKSEEKSPIKLFIQPVQPTSSDCLRIIVQGQAENLPYRWEINGLGVVASQPEELCSDTFKRGDQVTVQVDTTSATVVIGNSPPKVTGISTTPQQLYAGTDVEVLPVGEDQEGDPVKFRYQWFINSEAEPFLTEAKLPGDRFVKGDRLQVRITPFDGQDEGPVYESYVM